ncbi:amidase [Rhodococcus sp. IEGM 1330]|uniref:amidase n=1 Tax=Rhodococcus sp. IEGM 1330 TaxID=3082225 RepID=UPI00295338DD|nr:amidase [Rhodococcus sp. IEGM 1330]MDV8024903.1 amidase [Rhodococcus sp. IEGM 1330]
MSIKDRRGVLLLITALTLSAVGCQSTSTSDDGSELPLQGLGVEDIRSRLVSGQYTSADITRAYLDRIEKYDDSGPTPLHAVVDVNADAVAEATTLDDERAAGTIRGPLHGIPVLLKNNIGSAELPSTAGNVNLSSFRPDEDSPVVRNLRESGAIILGTTNMSEFAWHGTFTESSVEGRTANIFDRELSASGSSGGSAVAVAAGFAPIALGTDSCGSVVGPAAHAGLVGFRPSHDAISREGVVPLSLSQDVVGPIGHSVADAAEVADLISGGANGWSDSAAAVDLTSVRAAYLTWPFDARGADPDSPDQAVRPQIRSGSDAAVEALTQSGPQLVDLPELNKEFATDVLTDSGYKDARPSIDQFLSSTNATYDPEVASKALPSDALTFEDVTEGSALEAETITEWLAAPSLPNPAQDAILAKQQAGTQALTDLMTAQNVDVLIYPTTPETASAEWAGTAACGISANTGAPSVQIPIGTTSEGLPFGLTVAAAPGQDATALAVARALEDSVNVDIEAPEVS